MSTGQYNATVPTVVSGQNAELQLGQRGALRVELTDGGGTGTVSAVPGSDGLSNAFNGILTTTRVQVFNGTAWDRDVKPNAISRIASSAASNNATVAKASAGNVFIVSGVNTNAAARYLKFYNKATTPAPASDTPFWVEYLPPSTVNGGKFYLDFESRGLYFSTGIGWALVTGSADNDNTSVTAGDILALNISYS